MERHQITEAMTSLKLYGMRASFDEIAGKGLGRTEELYPLLASLVRAEDRRGCPQPAPDALLAVEFGRVRLRRRAIQCRK